jgi:hypothetical protein
LETIWGLGLRGAKCERLRGTSFSFCTGPTLMLLDGHNPRELKAKFVKLEGSSKLAGGAGSNLTGSPQSPRNEASRAR